MASATSSFTSSSTSLLSSSLSSIRTPRHTPASSVNFRRPLPPVSAVYATAETSTTGGGVSTSLQTTSSSSFYEVLGIQAGASGKEIKAAYRKLARVLHPDAVAKQAAVKPAAEEFIRVHEAYATLSDPKKRADYDRSMWVKGRRLSYSTMYCTMGGTGVSYGHGTTSCSGFSGYTRRTWETDQCW